MDEGGATIGLGPEVGLGKGRELVLHEGNATSRYLSCSWMSFSYLNLILPVEVSLVTRSFRIMR